MINKLTVETLEETIMKLNKLPTEIIHFTCASCGKENDTPYAFLSLYRQRTICENCYRKEKALELRALLSEEKSKAEWAYYRYRCTGDRKWLKGVEK